MHALLLHGGGHGGWCWDAVRVHLADVGVDSSAPDLPGAGADSTPRANIVLDDYIAAAIQHVDRIDDDVTIVAHSIAGMTAPAVAVARPEKVSHVVLLAALVTQTGAGNRFDSAGSAPVLLRVGDRVGGERLSPRIRCGLEALLPESVGR